MSCTNAAGAPIPCSGWAVYDSYVTDPRYQRYFTIAWTCLFAVAFLLTLPGILGWLRSGQWKEGSLAGRLGLYEDMSGGYRRIDSTEPAPSTVKRTRVPRPLLAISAAVKSFALATPPLPSFLSLDCIPLLRPRRAPSCHPTRNLLPFSLGTLLLALLIPAFFLAMLLPESELRTNPNRFGFLALAAIPPTFVLSSKNGAVQWLLGKGWTSVNFLHRWLGRMMVLLVLLHFYFWTIQYAPSHQVTEFLSGTKEQRGIGALVFLLIIAISSAGPLRRFSYPAFFVLHYVGIIGFLVFVNKHTIYAQGWATYSVLGIYGLDILGRLAGMRVRYVEVEAMEGGMVRVAMRGLHGGWRAGQHVSLRLFFTPPSPTPFSLFRSFEAHPFSISNAPPSHGILNASSPERGAELFVRSCGKGSWTGDLYDTALLGRKVAQAQADERAREGGDGRRKTFHMLALVEGPYGGLGTFVAVEQETVLLVAGGSGMSFTLGVLDEVVGRRKQNGQGGKIEVVWAVRDKAQIAWFEEPLRTLINSVSSISNLTITLRIYLTCDPTLTTEPSAAPLNASTYPPSASSPAFAPLPHTQLIYARPHLASLVHDTLAAALAPCGNCYPVCRCGDIDGDGICANDEEECCGGPGPANGIELLGGSSEDDEKKGEKDMIDEVQVLPKSGKSCCSPTKGIDSTTSTQDDDILELDPPSTSTPACCSSKPGKGVEAEKAPACGGGCCAGTGGACCSGGVEGVREPKEEGPVRVRTAGMAVVVCGPGNMIAEMRNAVARVPIAKQARVGGIDLHSEYFSL
ncbi:ferric reductase like transmembrane component-domain-containing protein [Leucosporidium creatinivorum]|uniref:Ferric reductase like transmembrane component-domain-containing protein n=1 Tax=Leucosporidium creatinivorum TaxID=106004 RepID=A0A1Y2G0R8_9BASI|nr:ferric reductase like transmembrane component-domain-containing protein [Leucosporidium creatinivorum]